MAWAAPWRPTDRVPIRHGVRTGPKARAPTSPGGLVLLPGAGGGGHLPSKAVAKGAPEIWTPRWTPAQVWKETQSMEAAGSAAVQQRRENTPAARLSRPSPALERGNHRPWGARPAPRRMRSGGCVRTALCATSPGCADAPVSSAAGTDRRLSARVARPWRMFLTNSTWRQK